MVLVQSDSIATTINEKFYFIVLHHYKNDLIAQFDEPPQ